MSNLFLDFDGSLLDCRRRLYGLLSELAPDHGLSLDEYWILKREGLTQPELLRQRLGFSESAVAEYRRRWLEHIEEDFRLDQDVLFPGLESFLRRQAEIRNLYLVTNRQSRERTVRQIGCLGLANYFQKILVTEHKCSKSDMVRNVGLIPASQDIFLGDTGEDILAARELGCLAVGLSWGFQSREGLARYQPDFMVDKVKDLDQCQFLQP